MYEKFYNKVQLYFLSLKLIRVKTLKGFS